MTAFTKVGTVRRNFVQKPYRILIAWIKIIKILLPIIIKFLLPLILRGYLLTHTKYRTK